jgi:hypothetical protein
VEGPDAARVQKADRDGCAAVAGTQKV